MFERLPPEIRLEIYHLILQDPILFHPHDQYKLSRPESRDLVRNTRCPLLRTNKHIRSEYAPLFHRSFVHRFAVSHCGVWWPTQTPHISSVYGTDEKWVATQDLRPEMSRWRIEVTLADEPPMWATRNEYWSLVHGYNGDARDRRRERAVRNISEVRMWLRGLVLRLLQANVEPDEVKVVVLGGDQVALRQWRGQGEEGDTDLLAPLRKLSLRSGAGVDIEIAAEGKEPMDHRCEGYDVAVANRVYVEEVLEAMMREKSETRDKRIKQESSLLAKSIRDIITGMIAEDDDPNGEGARQRVQAALRTAKAETKFEQPWVHWKRLFKLTDEYCCYRREELTARGNEGLRKLMKQGTEEKAYRMLNNISEQSRETWRRAKKIGDMRVWLPL